MPPAEPPRRGKLPSVHEETAPGAIHEPGARPATDTVSTVPPPAPDRRPFPRPSVAGIRVPTLAKPPPLPRVESDERTVVGPIPVLAAPERQDSDGDRDSTHEAPTAADALAAQLAARNVELARIRAELEAERRKAAPAPSLVPPAEVEQYERKLERKAHKLPSDVSLKPLVLKLVAALTGLAAALTVTVQLANAWLEPRIKNVEAKQSAQAETLKPLPAAAASADKSADACRDWARAKDDYDRQVFAKLGVVIPQQPNAQPVTEIKTRAPVRKANSVTGAPVLEVLTPPPPLP